MEKLKFGFYWAASCGGCEIAVLDVDEKILDVLQIADVVFWPVAMDVKYKDVEEMVDGYMDVCFFNGGIRNSEQEHLAKLLRRKAKYMVAFGACAQLGGVPGLANLSTKREILDRSYHTTESTDNKAGTEPQPKHKLPEGESEIPVLSESVKPLDRIILVDYYVPGCPPPPKLIFNAIDAITKGQLPPALEEERKENKTNNHRDKMRIFLAVSKFNKKRITITAPKERQK